MAVTRQAAVVIIIGLPCLLSACTSDPDPYVSEPVAYGFEAHLEEAIALNKERGPIYGDMTGGASLALSEMLISSERIALFVAVDLDARARPFWAEGIPVVAADFVSMEGVAEVDEPPTWTGGWSASVAIELADVLAGLAGTDAGDFEAICADADEVLIQLDQLEAEHAVHLAMTRHVVESSAFAALHAMDYAERSDGRTEDLSRDLIGAQLQILQWGVAQAFDQRAAALHAMGVGILINDFPHIPFAEEYGSH